MSSLVELSDTELELRWHNAWAEKAAAAAADVQPRSTLEEEIQALEEERRSRKAETTEPAA
jgi:hypothetical protein